MVGTIFTPILVDTLQSGNNMIISFNNTLLDCKPGTVLYMLVHGEPGESLWYTPVEFKELQCDEREDRYGHENFSEKDLFTILVEQTTVNSRGKVKKEDIRIRWTHWPRHYETKINKGKHKVFINACNLKVTKWGQGGFVLLADDFDIIKKYVEEKDLVKSRHSYLVKKKEDAEKTLNYFETKWQNFLK